MDDSLDESMKARLEARRKQDRIWLYVAAAFALFWGVYLVFFMPGLTGAPRLANSGIPIPADYGWTASDLEGNTVNFSKFKGRPVFLNIWATWCGPCIAEMPSIAKLAENPRIKGKVDFVCVSVDNRVEVVKKFVADKKWPMNIFNTQALPDVFVTDGIPATFIIAADGTIVATEMGSVDWDNNEVIEFLEKLTSK